MMELNTDVKWTSVYIYCEFSGGTNVETGFTITGQNLVATNVQ